MAGGYTMDTKANEFVEDEEAAIAGGADPDQLKVVPAMSVFDVDDAILKVSHRTAVCRCQSAAWLTETMVAAGGPDRVCLSACVLLLWRLGGGAGVGERRAAGQGQVPARRGHHPAQRPAHRPVQTGRGPHHSE